MISGPTGAHSKFNWQHSTKRPQSSTELGCAGHVTHTDFGDSICNEQICFPATCNIVVFAVN